jgi:hypothetical protein
MNRVSGCAKQILRTLEKMLRVLGPGEVNVLRKPFSDSGDYRVLEPGVGVAGTRIG